MKKISLLITAFVFSSALMAQHLPKFGLKGGLNISSMKWNVDLEPRMGLHAGLLSHIHLAPQWALQPELVYSMEGATHAFTNIAGNNVEVTYKNDYVNIPIMLQYMFNNGFRIEAGPQLGLLVSSKEEDDEGNEGSAKDIFKSTNLSVGLGLSYLSETGFGVGGRYNLGVSDINETGWPEAKGRVGQISIFYMFDQSHKAKSK